MESDRLDRVFAALANPARRRLLERLRDGDATVNELAAPLQLGLPAVSKHLTVLEHAGLIQRNPVAQWRRCSLDPAGFTLLAEWSSHYTELWLGSLDRLGTLLHELQEDGS